MLVCSMLLTFFLFSERRFGAVLALRHVGTQERAELFAKPIGNSAYCLKNC